MNAQNVIVRPMEPGDGTFVTALSKQLDMEITSEGGKVFIAWLSGKRVGFIRIVDILESHYVSPVAVAPDAQGTGIGAALMNHAIRQYGSLGLVARGYAVPFYEKLGFAPTQWENLPLEITEDCTTCPQARQCNPLPMCL